LLFLYRDLLQGAFSIIELLTNHFACGLSLIQSDFGEPELILSLPQLCISVLELPLEDPLLIEQLLDCPLQLVVVVADLVVLDLDLIVQPLLLDGKLLQRVIPLPLHLVLLNHDVMVALHKLHQVVTLISDEFGVSIRESGIEGGAALLEGLRLELVELLGQM
jgi:hypothetical protein